MDRDILVLVVISVDNKEGSLQVRERTTLKHLSHMRIRPGKFSQMGESSEALREVLPRGLPAVAYQQGGTLLLLILGNKGSNQRVYDGKKLGH